MNCEMAEKQVLLQESGELSRKDAAMLESHLRRCDHCRHFSQSLANARLALVAADEPDVRTVQDVIREARLLAPERKPLLIFTLKPALAAAAMVVIGLGLFLSSFGPGRVGMELEVTELELMESDDQIVDVMYSGLSEDDLAFNFLMTFEEG